MSPKKAPVAKKTKQQKKRTERRTAAEAPVVLQKALKQSRGVKVKVEAAATDLAKSNQDVKRTLDRGKKTVSAQTALETGETVEEKVQECAVDLHEVNETLAQGIHDLKRTEAALKKSRKLLADTENALNVAQTKEQRARHRSLHDPLTGLPNRQLFNDRLEHAIALAERHGWTLAVLFLDLDRFKNVNDDHGHDVGDAVLKEIAERLANHAREEDTVCRMGGDEFLYLLMNPGNTASVKRVVETILHAAAQPIEAGEWKLEIRPSIGVAMFPGNGTTVKELVKHADAAMYRAKKARTGHAFF